MNTLFWIIVAAMLLSALVILLLPLWKNQTLVADDHSQRNIEIARQRLAELKQQLQDNVLTQVEFDEQYAELQLMLNDDLEAQAKIKPTARQGRWAAIMLLTLLPVISLLLYRLLGDPNALAKAEWQANQSKAVANIAQMVSKLEQRLKVQPNDAEGWMMLGRSYSYMQQYQNAAEAFARLYRLQPDNLEAAIQYANNLAMSRNGRMAGEPAQLVEQVLQRAPDNPNALWLAGIAKAEAGQFADAKTHWQALLMLLPADSEMRTQVEKMLVALDQEMTQSETASPVSIAVNVDISAELQGKFAPDTTVFVYAQALNGPKMPLAIVRKTVADLPLQVSLSDAQAMQPGMKLADQPRLRIVARISPSGQAMPQAGDWLGSSEVDAPFAEHAVTVSINQEVK